MVIEPRNPSISVLRQCELMGLARSSYYFTPASDDPFNLLLMRLLDEQYLRTPFYGIRRMTAWLQRQEYDVNHKRVRRLLRLMGLMAIYQKPRLSLNGKEHRQYPYLLRGLAVTRPSQVWCADITYIRMANGFLYLVAILDWYSRYVLSWRLSNCLETDFCLEALDEALGRGTADIFNTDKGVQFTSAAWLDMLEARRIRVSMDGRGRCFDNIFVERFWRSLKYEEVYLQDYLTVADARRGVGAYMKFYNEERLHESLGYMTPLEVHRRGALA
jgi:putative transposase